MKMMPPWSRTLSEMMIDVMRAEDVRRLPDGSFYLPLVEGGEPMTIFLRDDFIFRVSRG